MIYGEGLDFSSIRGNLDELMDRIDLFDRGKNNGDYCNIIKVEVIIIVQKLLAQNTLERAVQTRIYFANEY